MTLTCVHETPGRLDSGGGQGPLGRFGGLGRGREGAPGLGFLLYCSDRSGLLFVASCQPEACLGSCLFPVSVGGTDKPQPGEKPSVSLGFLPSSSVLFRHPREGVGTGSQFPELPLIGRWNRPQQQYNKKKSAELRGTCRQEPALPASLQSSKAHGTTSSRTILSHPSSFSSTSILSTSSSCLQSLPFFFTPIGIFIFGS